MTLSAEAKKAVILGLLTIAAFVPPIIGIGFGQGALSAQWVFGCVISIVAALLSTQLAIRLVPVTGLVMFGAALLHPYPLLGATFYGVVAAVAALMSRRGLHSATLLIPLFAAFPLLSPPQVPWAPEPWQDAAVIGLATAAGSLWLIAVMHLLLGAKSAHLSLKPVTSAVAVSYAIIMGTITGVTACVLLLRNPSHQGTWLLLTLVILLQPAVHDTISRSIARTLGTILGVGVAAVLGQLVTATTVRLILAAIFLFGALLVRYALKRPYWQYVSLLTPAVILMDSASGGMTGNIEDRVLFTLLGAAVAIAVALTAKFVYLRLHPDGEEAAEESSS